MLRRGRGPAANAPRSDAAQAGIAAALLASVSVLTGLSNLAFNVVVARSGGSEAYGAYGALTTLPTIAGVLAVATNYTVARRVARADHLDGRLIYRSLLASWPWLLLGMGLTALTPLIQSYLRVASAVPVFTADIVFLVIVAAAAPVGILIGLRRFRALALLNLAGAIARLCAGPILARGENATAGALAASILTALVTGSGALVVVLASRRRAATWFVPAATDGESEGRLSTETMGAALLAGMLWSLWSMPLLLARHALTADAAGSFAAAQVLAGSLLFLALPAVTAFFPVTARGRTSRIALLGLAGLVAVCAAGAVFLAVGGPTLMGVLYGGGYSASGTLFAALTVSAGLVACANYSAWMTRAMRRLVWVAFAGAATAVAAELAVGIFLEPSVLGVALLPGAAVVLGLAMIVAVVPDTTYAHAATGTSRMVTMALRLLRARASTLTGRVTDRRPVEPDRGGGRRRAALERAREVLARRAPEPVSVPPPPRSRFHTARLAVAGVGVASLLMLGVAGEGGTLGTPLSYLALAALLIATAMAFGGSRRGPHSWLETTRTRVRWYPAFLAAGGMAAVAAQSWFRLGTEIAGGDVAPADGTAWLARMFAPWNWTGSNLGGPAATERQLPWAGVLGATHSLGGSEVLAQRLWLTLVFTGVGLAIVALVRTLGLGRAGAVAAAAVYLFNARTLIVVPNDVFLLSALLLPAIAAVFLAHARGTLSLRRALILLVLCAPLIGYMGQQPALVLMLGVAVLACPAVAAWLGGRAALRRCALGVTIGGLVLAAACAYWLLPTLIQTTGAAVGQLSNVNDWSWTEGRATVANGFWLNTSWGWVYPQYFPFAGGFAQQPLQFLKFALPAAAFAALLLPGRRGRNGSGAAALRLRVATAAAALALGVIVLSTGTNPPGSVVFNVLYRLPFGWLLREPAHFLGVAALGITLLVATGVDHLAGRWSPRLSLSPPRWRARIPLRVAMLVAGVSALGMTTAYPILTGAVIPDARPKLPSEHVAMPQYWNDMAGFANALPPGGDMLVLPPDDFYQADYSWGYSGSDSFISNLMSHRVLDPLPGGYLANDLQLMGVVDQINTDIIARDWTGVTVLSRALHTPWLLVRGDIVPPSQGAGVDPAQLTAALSGAQGIRLIHQSGPLELFSVDGVASVPGQTANWATVSTDRPNLDVLRYLPGDAQLVTSPPRPGVTTVVQVPPVTAWQDTGSQMSITVAEPAGRTYRVAPLNADHATLPGVVQTPGPESTLFAVPVADRVVNGTFGGGLWSPLGDCDEVHGALQSGLAAGVDRSGGPGGLPALRLTAHFDTACERQPLSWNGGQLVLSMMVRNLSGIPARLCVYEVELDTCASSDPLPVSSSWAAYRSLVVPDSGVSHLVLFLYADGSAAPRPTVDLFADVRVLELPGQAPQFDVIGIPSGSVAPPLVTQTESYNSLWSGPATAPHVLVDGMFNGWIGMTDAQVDQIRYRPAVFISGAAAVSLGALMLAVSLSIGLLPWARVRRRLVRPTTPVVRPAES